MAKAAGYSGKSLVEKLGYEPDDSVYVLEGPDWFLADLKKAKIKVSELPATWCHGFFMNQAELETFLNITDLSTIKKGLWVSWPKKSSGQTTDLTEQTFRDLILPRKWVDVKVAAIDDTWSGLKFLRRQR